MTFWLQDSLQDWRGTVFCETGLNCFRLPEAKGWQRGLLLRRPFGSLQNVYICISYIYIYYIYIYICLFILCVYLLAATLEAKAPNIWLELR